MINKQLFQTPDKEHRVDVRWWLAEGLHTDQTLKNEIRMLDESGFGALEFLAMDEPGADSTLYGWGSEEWVHDSSLIIEETTRRGMGFSVTSGTNWANANLISITPDDKAASKELDYVVETLHAGEIWSKTLPKAKILVKGISKQLLIAVIAAKVTSEKDGEIYLDEHTLNLTDLVTDNTLTWQAPEDGTYKLFFFWLHGTGQIARPSVSTSYTINYLDRYGIEAFIDYWDKNVLTDSLRQTIIQNSRGMMYMDSLELTTFGRGGQLWGYHFIEEFRARRGYDITPYLPFIVKVGGMMTPVFTYHFHMEDTRKENKIKNDLYQTMTDLYIENMLQPMQKWLHSAGMKLRAEVAYGLPFEVTQSCKYVDGIETESLEFASQIDSYRGMSGAAHIYNKVFSSETGATSLNYMMGLDFYTQIMYAQFAAGISRTVLHGYSSICGSETYTYWPGFEGMWPYFSERFGSRQPAWQHYNDWTRAMARYQLAIRQGTPRMDLGILRLDYYFNNLVMFGDTRETYGHQLMRGNDALYWKDMSLQNAGYTWDYFAPQLLEEDFTEWKCGELYPNGPGYRALIVYQEYMPVSSAKKLLELAKNGLNLVFVNGCTETIRPGVTQTHAKAASQTPFLCESDETLTRIINEIKQLPNVMETDMQADTIHCLHKLGVEPRAKFSVPNKNILTFMNETEEHTGLFVYNMLYEETEPFTVTLEITGGGRPYQLNCWNGKITELSGRTINNNGAADVRTAVTLTLNPGEATMLLFEHAENARELPADRIYRDVIDLDHWHLVVEDWNAGDRKVITEDRGKGLVTREVYYETRKTPIEVGEVTLKPWKDYPEVGKEVSGVGYYTTTVTLPANWSETDGAELSIASTNGNTAAVSVNGRKAEAYDFNKKRVDLSDLLTAGKNEIRVEVSSTLNNRLLARNYYEDTAAYSRLLCDAANNAHEDTEFDTSEKMDFRVHTDYHDYGMVGEVKLNLYTLV